MSCRDSQRVTPPTPYPFLLPLSLSLSLSRTVLSLFFARFLHDSDVIAEGRESRREPLPAFFTRSRAQPARVITREINFQLGVSLPPPLPDGYVVARPCECITSGLGATCLDNERACS